MQSFKSKNIWLIASILLLISSIFFAGCEKALQLKNPADDGNAVFNDLWKSLDQNYALFTIKGINWDSVYTQNKGKFSSTSNVQLFTDLSHILDVLQDGHVSLISSTDTATYQNFYTTYARNFNWANIKNNYLDNQYTELGPFTYKTAGTIGYLYCSSFRPDIPEEQLKTIFSTFNNTTGLILDLRNNSGGSVANVEKLFSRFINSKTLVRYELKKKGAGHLDFYDKEPFYVNANADFYPKKIILLTNRTCFSACNDLVMYMSYLPQVTIVGDQTGGGGSIPANYLLVNGWKLQYSSAITLNPDEQLIENGIQPDINVGISSIEETQGKDPILQKAIDLLQ